MTIKRYKKSKIWSKCVEAAGLVFTSGVVAEDLSTDVKGQTQQILAELEGVLTLAGSNKESILYTQIWLSDIRLRDAINDVWTAWIGTEHLPARACVEARLANPHILVEIQMTAAKAT